MKKHSFAYIHSNHTTPLIENIKLPFRVKPKEIKDLNRYHFQNYEESIVLFSLTGHELLRKKEEKILQDILSAPKKTIFLIITPFNFIINGYDVNSKDALERTGLYYAIFSGSLNIVKIYAL